MQPLNERVVLIIILVVLSVSTLFCLLGIAVPGWAGYSLFTIGKGSTIALCIISFLLLIACVAIAAILLLGVLQYVHLPLIFVLVLIITSLFILGAFTSAIDVSRLHSYNLIITSFTFTYLSSIFATYWLFGVRGTGDPKVSSTNQQKPPQLGMS